MDEKRLRGEEEHTISQGEIDAWKRGDQDGLRDRLLRAQTKLSPEKAIAFIKLYAQFGDVHALSVRMNIPVDELNRVLKSFSVNSIEDARALVRDGIIADYDRASEEQAITDEAEHRAQHEEAQERLTEIQERAAQENEKTADEIDAILAERREEAQVQNKRDQIRSLVAEGIDPDTGRSDFRIPLQQVGEFKQLIPYGVGQLQRRFGGSKADIVKEVKRLAPSINTDMLRP